MSSHASNAPAGLRDKIALVTGAAHGLGRAAVRMLAARGASVVICDVDEEHGARLAAELMSLGHSARFLPLDVGAEGDWVRVAQSVGGELGGLHILINNAGIIARRGIMEATLQDWQRVMDVNVTGAFLGIQRLASCATVAAASRLS